MNQAVIAPEVVETPHDLTVAIVLTDDIRRQLSANGASLTIANSIIVEDDEGKQTADEEMLAFNKQIAGMTTMYEDLAAEPKKSLEKLKNWFRPGIEERRAAIDILKGRIKFYLEHKAAEKAIEDQRRAAEAARIRQETEAKAAAETARAEQQAAEKRRQAEEADAARKKAEAEGDARAAATAAAASARAMQEAQAAIENGQQRAQAATLAGAAAATAAAPTAIKGKGGLRDKWIAQLKPNTTAEQAKALIVAAAVNNPMLMGLIKIDLAALDKSAAAFKTALDVPGYVAVNDQRVVSKHK